MTLSIKIDDTNDAIVVAIGDITSQGFRLGHTTPVGLLMVYRPSICSYGAAQVEADPQHAVAGRAPGAEVGLQVGEVPQPLSTASSGRYSREDRSSRKVQGPLPPPKTMDADQLELHHYDHRKTNCLSPTHLLLGSVDHTAVWLPGARCILSQTGSRLLTELSGLADRI